MAPIADDPRRVAGVALAAQHALITPDAVRAFLGGGEPAPEGTASLSAGDIAAREKEALVAVFCQKISGGERPSVRDYAGQNELLERDQQAEHERQDDAVPERAGEHHALLPVRSVTETPVAIFCGEIILPITPPDELVAANRSG